MTNNKTQHKKVIHIQNKGGVLLPTRVCVPDCPACAYKKAIDACIEVVKTQLEALDFLNNATWVVEVILHRLESMRGE